MLTARGLRILWAANAVGLVATTALLATGTDAAEWAKAGLACQLTVLVMLIARPYVVRGGGVELAAWHEATSLRDLGRLTAAWLRGDLPAHPGYRRSSLKEAYEVWEALGQAPQIASTLEVLNVAGLVTVTSQPGCDEVVDGVRWRQRAGVSFLAEGREAVSRMVSAARAGGLVVVEHGPRPRWRDRTAAPVPVTQRDDQDVDWLGAYLSARTLRRAVFPGCLEAIIAAGNAWQVTVVDPEWATNERLWSTLTQAALAARAGELRDLLLSGAEHVDPEQGTPGVWHSLYIALSDVVLNDVAVNSEREEQAL